MDFRLVNVGIADMGISTSPDVLRTILGSCVGICLYDADNRVGGISHIMLPRLKPDSTAVKKYADSAIPLLFDELLQKGAKKEKIIAKIIGGATMFKLSGNSLMGEIGRNNISMTKQILSEMHIDIIAEDTGGDFGRTIDFFLETGEIKIKSIGKDDKII